MVQGHYYYFGKSQNRIKGDSLDSSNWDALRTDENETPFSIENSIESYENNCRRIKSYENAASIIVSELDKMALLGPVVSLGVGKGILEWHIKKQKPELCVECTDYTPEAIEKLKKVFPDVNAAYTFDMLKGDYRRFQNYGIVLLYRVSTEFDRDQWHDIFKSMYDGGIMSIVFVPTGLDDKKQMRMERIKHYINKIRGRKDIFCGWLYSEDEFLKMFYGDGEKALYTVNSKIPYENTAIYFLRKNQE